MFLNIEMEIVVSNNKIQKQEPDNTLSLTVEVACVNTLDPATDSIFLAFVSPFKNNTSLHALYDLDFHF